MPSCILRKDERNPPQVNAQAVHSRPVLDHLVSRYRVAYRIMLQDQTRNARLACARDDKSAELQDDATLSHTRHSASIGKRFGIGCRKLR
jgi:hypothetical protein